MKYLCNSETETVELGLKLGKTLRGGDVVLLGGDLGAGKTTFTKGLAKALGIGQAITSPTFTLCNLYEGDKAILCHIDAYRLKNAEEAIFAGLGEHLGEKSTVCVIEWHENISSILTINRAVKVDIVYISDFAREIEIVK